jgi:hypothetical protein
VPTPLPPPSPDLATGLLGYWRLLAREDFDAEGRRRIDPAMGSDPLGALAFFPGQFAAQFMKRDRGGEGEGAGGGARGDEGAAGKAAASANNSAAVNGYDAYFGSYTVDAANGTITVHLEGALAPQNVGQSFTRAVRVEGDRLLIRLATHAHDGTPITRTLTFERRGS